MLGVLAVAAKVGQDRTGSGRDARILSDDATQISGLIGSRRALDKITRDGLYA